MWIRVYSWFWIFRLEHRASLKKDSGVNLITTGMEAVFHDIKKIFVWFVWFVVEKQSGTQTRNKFPSLSLFQNPARNPFECFNQAEKHPTEPFLVLIKQSPSLSIRKSSWLKYPIRTLWSGNRFFWRIRTIGEKPWISGRDESGCLHEKRDRWQAPGRFRVCGGRFQVWKTAWQIKNNPIWFYWVVFGPLPNRIRPDIPPWSPGYHPITSR